MKFDKNGIHMCQAEGCLSKQLHKTTECLCGNEIETKPVQLMSTWLVGTKGLAAPSKRKAVLHIS